MRKTFTTAYEDIQNLQNHKEIVTTSPVSAQQRFLQTLANINLCNRKQAIGQIVPLLNSYKGSFSHQILILKYCTYCMETDKTKTYNIFNVLKLLSKWVVTLQVIKKKKDLRLCQAIIDSLQLGICTYQQFIVYQNYIGNDVIALIKSGTQQTRKKYPDLSKHPHLDPADLTKYLSIALPKILVNMMVPRNFFPPTLIRNNQQNIDILYSNQNYENIAQNKTHFNSLIRTIFKSLFVMQLQPSQTKQLVLSAFKYFYLFHYDKNYNASQFVIQSFKKMTSAVRFAILDQISLFFVILKKLGKQLFVSYLTQKFSWVGQIVKNKTVIGMNKATLKPFGNQNLGNSLKIRVQAGKFQQYYLEVYDRFSLVYFCIKCLQHDITIRFYYLGDFKKQQGVDDRKLLISSQKKQGIFQGSVQTIQKGIYLFQFDNSYAWMKAKTLVFDLSIFVPIQIKQHANNKIKQLVFEKNQHLNEVPYENVIGWVDQNQIRLNSTSANISYIVDGNVKVYNVKLIRNTGQAYEYQTQSKYRFLKKLRLIQKDPNLFWLIDGYKIKGIQDVQKWLQGDFEPQKLQGNFDNDKQMRGQAQNGEQQLSSQEQHVEQLKKQQNIKTEQKIETSQKDQQPDKVKNKEEQKLQQKSEQKVQKQPKQNQGQNQNKNTQNLQQTEASLVIKNQNEQEKQQQVQNS